MGLKNAVGRNAEDEATALAFFGFHADRAAMQFQNPLADPKTQSRAQLCGRGWEKPV